MEISVREDIKLKHPGSPRGNRNDVKLSRTTRDETTVHILTIKYSFSKMKTRYFIILDWSLRLL